VEYQDLPVLDSPFAALAPGAPILHAGKPDNVLVAYQVQSGDLTSGFAKADIILEETYLTGAQEHAYLQPDAGLAWIDKDGRLVVHSAGQWTHDDIRQIAHSLDLPEERVRVRYAHIGGAFGGREDLNLPICLALAAWKLRRPVKATWSREETTIGHPKRHPMHIRHRWGVTRAGKLVAQEIEIVADAGAYASTSASVLGTAVMMCSGPYVVPNVRVNARAVYTNNPVSGAFRGFGAPQAIFAAEAHMARLAAALDLDPVELRLRNLVAEGSHTATIGRLPPGVSARETLETAARAAGWVQSGGSWRRPARQSSSDKLRGVGIAVGCKPIGYPLGWQEQATITIELNGTAEIETAIVRSTVADLGQGAHTAICQMAAQALDLPSSGCTWSMTTRPPLRSVRRRPRG
jgi:CO/xanthine dehydrogenase Mo-binding subunit